MNNDFISREALKKEVVGMMINKADDLEEVEFEINSALASVCEKIDNAPTVAVNCKDCDGYEAGYSAGLKDAERPQGEWIEMKTHFCTDCLYFNSDNHIVSWNEMQIGTIYYHLNAHYYAIKTGTQSFFNITNNKASKRGTLLKDAGDYKNFVECSYRIQINGGVDLSGK